MEKLNKAIEKYKVDCVSDFYEIDKVSEFIDHIKDDDSDFKNCVVNSIEKLERLLNTDKVAYCCLSDNDVYSFAQVLQMWEEDQEYDKDQDIKIFKDIREFFKWRVKNNLMNDYSDYQLFEYVKNEVGEKEPFAYDVYTESLIKGE